jgi:hypothetical protein
MDRLLVVAGRALGIVGLLICLAAGLYRLTGHYHLGGFQLVTLLQAGVAGLVGGSFLILWGLSAKSGS